mmetsp:Transcript_5534/g.11514  ORF Transcript_5534/g.11514 Transcript_5534/m.11514 type:complete len:118 (+) Transcript_5534:471-824(+)
MQQSTMAWTRQGVSRLAYAMTTCSLTSQQAKKREPWGLVTLLGLLSPQLKNLLLITFCQGGSNPVEEVFYLDSQQSHFSMLCSHKPKNLSKNKNGYITVHASGHNIKVYFLAICQSS